LEESKENTANWIKPAKLPPFLCAFPLASNQIGHFSCTVCGPDGHRSRNFNDLSFMPVSESRPQRCVVSSHVNE